MRMVLFEEAQRVLDQHFTQFALKGGSPEIGLTAEEAVRIGAPPLR